MRHHRPRRRRRRRRRLENINNNVFGTLSSMRLFVWRARTLGRREPINVELFDEFFAERRIGDRGELGDVVSKVVRDDKAWERVDVLGDEVLARGVEVDFVHHVLRKRIHSRGLFAGDAGEVGKEDLVSPRSLACLK